MPKPEIDVRVVRFNETGIRGGTTLRGEPGEKKIEDSNDRRGEGGNQDPCIKHTCGTGCQSP